MQVRSRGYLPHITSSGSNYFVTFRLEDSLPVDLLQKWKQELKIQSRFENHPAEQVKAKAEYIRKVERELDSLRGKCSLKNYEVSALVNDALRHFNEVRYVLHAFTIMPNHVHVLFQPIAPHTVEAILHSWKSFTAHAANRILQQTGRFWQPEYFDTLIKSERHFHYCLRYILNNPVKAGLCENFMEWQWTKCFGDAQVMVNRFFRERIEE